MHTLVLIHVRKDTQASENDQRLCAFRCQDPHSNDQIAEYVFFLVVQRGMLVSCIRAEAGFVRCCSSATTREHDIIVKRDNDHCN